jgi:VanZ family protein
MPNSRHLLRGKDTPRLHSQKVIVEALLRWLAVVLWMGLIFALSATPSLRSPLEPVFDFVFRKLAHIGEYGVLTALLFGALRIYIAQAGHALLTAALVAVVYAFTDEWHQMFVPGREGSLRDVGIDALGVLGAFVWFSKIRPLPQIIS